MGPFPCESNAGTAPRRDGFSDDEPVTIEFTDTGHLARPDLHRRPACRGGD